MQELQWKSQAFAKWKTSKGKRMLKLHIIYVLSNAPLENTVKFTK